MRNLSFIIVAIACLAWAIAPANVLAQVKHQASAQSGIRHAQIKVMGASCMACIMTLAKKFHSIPGVIESQLSSRTPVKAVIIYDSKKIKLSDLMLIISQRDLVPKLIFDIPESEFTAKKLSELQKKES